MNNHTKIFLLVAVCAAGSLLTAQAQTIADWTFETSVPAGTPGAGVAFPGISPEVGSGTASGLHVGNSVYSTPVGNGSTHSFSSTLWAVGDYYQFAVSTTGYNNIAISFDQASSGTGPGSFQLEYSTDGTTYANIGTAYTVLDNGLAPNASWNSPIANPVYSYSENLSAITALNNAANVYFRLVDASTTSSSGGTVGTGGTDRVDNFDVSVVPEPTTIALASLGGLACLAARRRKY